jgi:hypothetical protein
MKAGSVERRTDASDLGGTMRLGAQECRCWRVPMCCLLRQGAYCRTPSPSLRSEQQSTCRNLKQAGSESSPAVPPMARLVEVVELPDHPWFVACQFHPEFTSTPRDGHPLFSGFVNAALAQKARRQRHDNVRRPVRVGNIDIGNDKPFVLFGGMNVLESRDLAMRACEDYVRVTEKARHPLCVQGLFDKANRSSVITSFRGPGLEEGLKIFRGNQEDLWRAGDHRCA